MRISRDSLKVVLIQYLEKDNDPSSEGKILVLPCKSEKAAKEFEDYYRKKFPPTQLVSIIIFDSPVYG